MQETSVCGIWCKRMYVGYCFREFKWDYTVLENVCVTLCKRMYGEYCVEECKLDDVSENV